MDVLSSPDLLTEYKHRRRLVEPHRRVGGVRLTIVNIGMFRSPERMGGVLALAGQHGWRLVGVYDKASNWLTNMEKGFMMLIRPVPDGATPREWCLILRG
jgi:hypothetical protein